MDPPWSCLVFTQRKNEWVCGSDSVVSMTMRLSGWMRGQPDPRWYPEPRELVSASIALMAPYASGSTLTLGSVQFSSVPQSCLTLWDPMDCSTPSLPVHHQLLEFTQIHVHWVGDAIHPSHPLLSPSPSCSQSFPASRSFQMSQFFASGGQSIGVSASTSVLPMNIQDWSPLGWTGWISFRMDWLDLFAVQGTLKSLLQHHSSKASILWCSAFFIVQLSHPYMTTEKTIALTRQTFVGKVMSLLFNMLSRLVTVFLPRIKHLLISWLQSPSAVILEPQKIKSLTVSHLFTKKWWDQMPWS